ncbi:MAG: hypothetical protein FWC56_03175, partial [Phycisphaerae bacterium]|nr:hypothetical protein [Phycisphaerae bacterium]
MTISMFRRYLSDRRVLAPSTLFFVALYAFFPNNPEARLAPQELLVVLFLSFHVYFMMGYLRPNSGCPHLAAFPSVRNYIGLFVSFCGLLWSKEPCLAFGAVTLTMLGWRPLIAFRSIRWRDVLSRIPFVLVFAHAFFKSYYISKAQGYGTAPLTSKLFQKNLNYYFDTLFLVHIGPFLWITALALLGLFVVVTLRVYWIRPMRSECRVDRRFVSPSSSTSLSSSIASAWALFGVFAIYGIAIFLMTLTSWIVVLRYVYPCVYCLCALMAIAMGEVCSHLNFRLAHPRSSQWRRIPGPIFGIACGLLATFFVAVNYYNFLSQYAVQYYTRKTEKRMLDGLAALLRSGQEVMLPVRYEHHASILAYWRQFLPELQQAGMIPQKFKWPPPTFPSGTLVVGMRE